jgi:sugar phosphate isomerase/epimerase
MPVIALSTGSLYTYSIARVFELAAEVGFEAIELMVDDRWDTRQPAYVRRLSSETALPVAAIHSPFVPYVPGWPHDALGRLRQSVLLAQEVGARLVVTHLPLRIRGARIQFFGFRAGPLLLPILLPNQGEYRRFLLDGLAELEEAEGVRIGVENMPAMRFLGLGLNIYALNNLDSVSTLPHLTLDTTHLGTWGIDLLAAYERLRRQVIHVHVSDFDGREHRLPGQGQLPLSDLLRRLAGDGFEGAISVELGPDVLQAEDEALVRGHLREAVVFCRQHLAG